MTTLQLRAVHKRFGQRTTVRDVNLDVASGEFIVFVGPSGCGKSTLLRMIAGLESVTSGQIRIGGSDRTHAHPSERGVAMVFQSYALYPHMSTRENLSFGMRMRGESREAIARKLDRAVAMLKLEPYLDRKPGELSGGQCQRIAIGRALVQEPQLFLFDEPLSNLDAELRLHMRLEIAALHRELKSTMIYVTHDQVEAMTLADRIVVLRDGRIEQVGAPMALYHQPATRFVAGFIGSPAMNFLPARVLPLLGTPAPAAAAEVGIRCEHLVADVEGPIAAVVEAVENLGAQRHVHLRSDHGVLCALWTEDAVPRVGEPIRLGVRGRHWHVFDAQGRRLHP